MGATPRGKDRRSKPRYGMELDLLYRVVFPHGIRGVRTGKTVNISASGVLLAVDEVLSPGMLLKIVLDWPAKSKEGKALKLRLDARVVRQQAGVLPMAAVKIIRSELTTRVSNGA